MTDAVFDWLYEAGLCWEVKEQTLQTSTGIVVPYKGLLKHNELLMVTEPNVKVVQNHEIAHNALQLCQQLNLNMPAAGGYYNSQCKVAVLYLYRYDMPVGSDIIRRYITLVNHFTKPPDIGFTLKSKRGLAVFVKVSKFDGVKSIVDTLSMERKYVTALRISHAITLDDQALSAWHNLVYSLPSEDAGYLIIESTKLKKPTYYNVIRLFTRFVSSKQPDNNPPMHVKPELKMYQLNKLISQMMFNQTKTLMVYER